MHSRLLFSFSLLFTSLLPLLFHLGFHYRLQATSPQAKCVKLENERKMNALLLQLKKKGSIAQNLYNLLRSSGGSTPLLYGLPKIHKPDVPLRPIVSFVQSPTYQLSKHLTRILSPLIGNTDSSVLNSVEFSSFIRQKTCS